jgi:hypothetical protein
VKCYSRGKVGHMSSECLERNKKDVKLIFQK